MITLELLVSLGSSFAAFGVARLYFQSLHCRQTECSGEVVAKPDFRIEQVAPYQ